jgi:hypothetical protein
LGETTTTLKHTKSVTALLHIDLSPDFFRWFKLAKLQENIWMLRQAFEIIFYVGFDKLIFEFTAQ